MRYCAELSYRDAASLINAALRRTEESLMKTRTLAEFIGRTGGYGKLDVMESAA